MAKFTQVSWSQLLKPATSFLLLRGVHKPNSSDNHWRPDACERDQNHKDIFYRPKIAFIFPPWRHFLGLLNHHVYKNNLLNCLSLALTRRIKSSSQQNLPVEETFSIAFHDIRMFLSQLLPLLAKSCVTILEKSPQGTIPGNCHIGADDARALKSNQQIYK